MAMDLNYGIGVKNRYALFMGDDESDPLDIISKCKEEASSSSSAAAGEKGTSTTVSNAHHHHHHQQHSSTAPSSGSALTAASKKGAVSSSAAHVANKKSSGGAATLAAVNQNFTAHHTTANVSHTTGGASTGENRSQNRPRQERPPKSFHQTKTSGGFGSSQENSWSNSGFGASRDQKEIDEKKNRRNREDRPFTQNNSEFRDRGDEANGKTGRPERGRGGGGFRPSRGARGGRGGSFDNRGKREYDRQSGSDKTGIKPNEKREGSGSFNWGTFNDELEGQTNPTQEENQDKSDENIFESETKENEVITDDTDKMKETEENADEEAAKEMTYDEWKKIEDEKRAKPTFNLRKPGEGEDVAQWKKTYVLKKKQEEEGDEEEYEEVEEEEIKHGRQKRILDIEINFKDENRDSRRGRGRGARGGGGPGRGAPASGGDRGERRERGERTERGGGTERVPGTGNRRNQPFRGRDSKEQSTPRVDDINDFPSLAAA